MPFGEKLQSDSANEDNMGFTGHINDATGLTYMQARFYNPVTARFLSVDPVGFLESGDQPAMYNRFSYAFNDPVNLTDPTGKCPMCIGTLVSTALETVIIGVEIATGNGSTSQEAAVRLGSSFVVGAAGVGVLTKVKLLEKLRAHYKKRHSQLEMETL